MRSMWALLLAALVSGCATTSKTGVDGNATESQGEIEEMVKLEGDHITVGDSLLFEINKADLDPRGGRALDAVARILVATPAIARLTIEGHADATGADSFNKKLSQERADAVKAYLVQKGIDAARLEAVGMGTEHPVVPNDTDANRARNRRVEFKVTR